MHIYIHIINNYFIVFIIIFQFSLKGLTLLGIYPAIKLVCSIELKQINIFIFNKQINLKERKSLIIINKLMNSY